METKPTQPNIKNPYIQENQNKSLFSSISGADFLTGLLLGAAGAYLLTNQSAQKTLMKAYAKGSEMIKMGLEEMKERYEDAKAEMQEA